MIAFPILSMSLILAGTLVLAVLLAGRLASFGHARGQRGVGEGVAPAAVAPLPPARDEPAVPSEAADGFEVEPELRAALHATAAAAAAGQVVLAIAATRGLTLRTDRQALRGALAEVLGQAIAAPSCGKVLVTARTHGGRVEIAVLDDGVRPDLALRRAALRGAEQAIGMQGGSLEVVAEPEEGTIVLLRLPVALRMPVADPADAGAGTPPARGAKAPPAAVRADTPVGSAAPLSWYAG